MRIKFFILLFLLLFVTSLTSAQEFLEYWGAMPLSYSAASLGMGNCSICSEKGPVALVINPSLLSRGSGWDFVVNGQLDKLNEIRSYPAYSFFDNLVGYQTYASNNYVFSRFSGGMVKNIVNGENITSFGVGLFPYIDFNYIYEEQVRNGDNPEPIRVATNYMERSGNIYTYSFGVSENFGNNFSIGLSYNYIEGKLNYLRSIIATPAGRDELELLGKEFDDQIYQSRYQFSGSCFSFGVSLFTKRVDLGLMLRTKADIGDIYVTNYNFILSDYGNLKMKFPAVMGIGIKYKPRSGIFTTFYFDVKKIFWGDFKNDLEPLTVFYDTLDLSFGVEHIFDSGIPFRFGFFNSPSYVVKGLSITGFSIGSAIRISNNARVDLGFQLAKRTYYYEDIFPDSIYDEFFEESTVDRSYIDKVNEVVNRIVVTYSTNY